MAWVDQHRIKAGRWPPIGTKTVSRAFVKREEHRTAELAAREAKQKAAEQESAPSDVSDKPGSDASASDEHDSDYSASDENVDDDSASDEYGDDDAATVLRGGSGPDDGDEHDIWTDPSFEAPLLHALASPTPASVIGRTAFELPLRLARKSSSLTKKPRGRLWRCRETVERPNGIRPRQWAARMRGRRVLHSPEHPLLGHNAGYKPIPSPPSPSTSHASSDRASNPAPLSSGWRRCQPRWEIPSLQQLSF